jgi:cation transport ATPase
MGKIAGPAFVARLQPWWEWALLAAVTAAVVGGAVLWFGGRPDVADMLWAGATVAALVPAIGWVLRSLLHRQVGVDVIAVLALAGALVVREYLAGAVVALMLATGRSLESYAERRASRDLRALLERGHAGCCGSRSSTRWPRTVPARSRNCDGPSPASSVIAMS